MTDESTDQGEGQSVMDRLNAKFEHLNGPESQAETPQQGTSETPFEPFEWEGETFQLPAKIKDALMRNADYTRKTQDLAEQRRHIDHVLEKAKRSQIDQSFSESVASEQQELGVIEAYLAQANKIDWGKMTTEQMLRQKVELDTVKERRDALKQSVAEKRGKFEQESKSWYEQQRAKARELASKAISGFSDDTEKAVRSYAASEGLSEAEIDNVLADARSYKVLWKAHQFDKISANSNKAIDATKALKPGGADNKMPPDVRQKLDFRKAMKSAKTSGVKASLIEERVASMFGGNR